MITLKYNFSNLIFFLLFPSTFIYLVLASLNIIPPFLGVYYSKMAVAIIMPLLIYYLVFTVPKIRQSTIYDGLFFMFIIYFSVILIANYNGGSSQHFINRMATLVYLITTFLVFRGINIESEKFYKLNAYFFIFMSLVVILLSKDGVFLLVVEGAGFTDNKASYQFIAVIYVLSFSIFLSRERVWYLRYVFYLLALTVLFINGARSEFIGLIVIIWLYEIIKSRNLLWAITVSGLSSALVLGVLTTLYFFKDLLASSNRTVELLTNTTQNASGLSRGNLTNNALNSIYENPFMGMFGNYEAGNYAHNILSVWVDFGIIGFLMYCALLLIPLFFVTYLIAIKKKKSAILTLLMCLIYISVLLVIFAKSISYIIPPAAFGLFSNYLSRFKLHHYLQKNS